ncbi:alpha/beta fold hydrolase [Euzebya pacifica]|uniref:alpha/beta fold hydrolase n=1 Tax=Euzebya pacifica TaxID=1608957 RepID=UPI0030FC1FBA
MRASLGTTAALLAAAGGSWTLRHATSPAVRGWSPPSGERLRAGGLAVRRLGRGADRPVTVLLHGLTASGDWWGGGFDDLAAHSEVIAPDLLGFGGSMDVQRSDFSREAHLDALDAMVQDLGLDGRPLTVVGHSMGTLAALHWAVRREETVRVVAFSAPLYVDRDEAEQHIARLGPLEAAFGLHTPLAERTCALMCRYRGTAQWLWTALSPQWPVRLARHGVLHTWPAYLGGMEGLIIRGGWQDAITELDSRGIPILLADGAQDPVPVTERADQLAAAHSCVQIARHETAAHDLPAAHPEWSRRQIADPRQRR